MGSYVILNESLYIQVLLSPPECVTTYISPVGRYLPLNEGLFGEPVSQILQVLPETP